jgi:hypothetical protein
VVEARLVPGDDFGLDDAAWLVVEEPVARRVLLVTSGNAFLARALGVRDDLELTTVAPADYRPPPAPYDLYVFDGFVPPGPLPQPALVVAPPTGSGPVAAGEYRDPGEVLPSDPREQLLQYVSLHDVHVQAAATVTPPPGWRTVIAAANGPLLLVHQGEPRVAQVNFDVHRSDLPLRPAFPILVQNLVSYLLPGGFEDQVLPLGRPVRLVADPGAVSLEVTSPDGRRTRLRPPFPATFEGTQMPGAYTVAQAVSSPPSPPAGSPSVPSTLTSHFVVQMQDPAQSRIGPGAKPVVIVAAPASSGGERGVLEIWPWLVAAALVGLVCEWALFLRG